MSTLNRVSEEKVERVIEESIITVEPRGMKTMILHAQLPNDFEITVSNACVSPFDFEHDTAEEICRERLKNKIWELLGFQAHPNL